MEAQAMINSNDLTIQELAELENLAKQFSNTVKTMNLRKRVEEHFVLYGYDINNFTNEQLADAYEAISKIQYNGWLDNDLFYEKERKQFTTLS